MIGDRFRRGVILIAAAVVYALRTFSCQLVLQRFSRFDNVPYADFDGHGITAMLGLFGGLACGVPIFWLLWRIVVPPAEPSPVAGRGVLYGSALVALAIAAPGFAQIEYMVRLPIAVMWPVVASAIAWAVVVAGLWVACVRSEAGRRTMARVRYEALGVAVVVTLPKLMVLTI